LNIVENIIVASLFSQKGEKGDKGDKGDAGTGGWSKIKKIIVTEEITAGTVINANSSGEKHTISGDAVDFGINSTVFNENLGMYITIDGVDQAKGTDIVYEDFQSFSCAYNLSAGDSIIILF